VTLVVVQVDAGARHVRGEPRAVGEGDHPVVRALPHRDRDPEVGQVEPPGADEREVVVAPAGDAGGDGPAERVRDHVGEVTGQRRLVDLVDQAAQLFCYLLPGHRREPGRNGVQEGLQRLTGLGRGAELLEVLRPHPV
jgi:hypothetical protein